MISLSSSSIVHFSSSFLRRSWIKHLSNGRLFRRQQEKLRLKATRVRCITRTAITFERERERARQRRKLGNVQVKVIWRLFSWGQRRPMFTTAVAIRSRFTRGITSVYRTRNLSNFLPESLCLGKSESFESNSYNTAYPRKFLFQIFFPFSLFKEKRRRRISKILPSFQKLTRKATRTFFELSNLPERIKIESLSLSLHRRIFAQRCLDFQRRREKIRVS